MTWLAGLRGRTRRELLAALLVLAGLTAFVVLVYVVVVLGGGALTGRTSSPGLALSVLATAIVAVAFDPVQTRLEVAATRAVHGGSPAPYDVLRRFSATVTGSGPTEELPDRMARVLAEGTGALWSQVWLVVGGRPSLAATWPPGATREPVAGEADPHDDAAPGRRSLPVRHGGELLGVLVVQEREHVPLTSVEQRLFAGLAGQAGLVLRSARLRVELEHRLAELTVRAEELRASRQRLVDVQDEQRRLLERDIHDGAQQHLVALAVNLRLAQTLSPRARRAGGPAAGRAGAGRARGDRNPRAALPRHLPAPARRGGSPRGPRGGCRRERGAGRRAHPGRRSLPAEHRGGGVLLLPGGAPERRQARPRDRGPGGPPRGRRLAVADLDDDGAGFDPATTPAGTGLSNMRDRIESVLGRLTIERAPGRGSRVRAVLPTASVAAVGRAG